MTLAPRPRNFHPDDLPRTERRSIDLGGLVVDAMRHAVSRLTERLEREGLHMIPGTVRVHGCGDAVQVSCDAVPIAWVNEVQGGPTTPGRRAQILGLLADRLETLRRAERVIAHARPSELALQIGLEVERLGELPVGEQWVPELPREARRPPGLESPIAAEIRREHDRERERVATLADELVREGKAERLGEVAGPLYESPLAKLPKLSSAIAARRSGKTVTVLRAVARQLGPETEKALDVHLETHDLGCDCMADLEAHVVRKPKAAAPPVQPSGSLRAAFVVLYNEAADDEGATNRCGMHAHDGALTLGIDRVALDGTRQVVQCRHCHFMLNVDELARAVAESPLADRRDHDGLDLDGVQHRAAELTMYRRKGRTPTPVDDDRGLVAVARADVEREAAEQAKRDAEAKVRRELEYRAREERAGTFVLLGDMRGRQDALLAQCLERRRANPCAHEHREGMAGRPSWCLDCGDDLDVHGHSIDDPPSTSQHSVGELHYLRTGER